MIENKKCNEIGPHMPSNCTDQRHGSNPHPIARIHQNAKCAHLTLLRAKLGSVFIKTHNLATKLNKLLALQWLGVTTRIQVVSWTAPHQQETLNNLVGDKEVPDIHMKQSAPSGTCPAICLKTCGTLVVLRWDIANHLAALLFWEVAPTEWDPSHH